MSDFLEKNEEKSKKQQKVYISKNSMSPTLVTAIDNLLCPKSDMFACALTVKKLMETERLSLSQAAEQLSLRLTDVANKLRLLEYSMDEKELILKLGLTERCAIRLLEADKDRREKLLIECEKLGLEKKKAQEYIINSIENLKENNVQKKGVLRKIAVCDAGFLIYSLDKAVMLAKQAGLKIESCKSESEKECFITIKIKKNVKGKL